MDGQKFCLKWDGFQSSVTSLFDHLRQDEELVDITLCCEGQKVRAHRMMLSACSPYFRDLLKNNPCQQMVFFLKDTSAADLRAIIEFMYKGSVNVAQSQLASFIKTAEMLQIRGLSGDDDKAAASPPPPDGVKVEKVDLTEDDDGDVSLDATLGYVAEYEGSYGEPDLSVSALVAGGATAAAAGGQPGPSQRPLDDTGPPGSVSCDLCGRMFSHTGSLKLHKKVHQGLTTCVICGKVQNRVFDLRVHLRTVHKLSKEDIASIVPNRNR
ncbi:sex determination protein fruitless-like [Pollicipes pollicipes]|uniref:sex determination protein fruitless-like n=1 Tax=Pollicipes pollicipes TaxID=41117 RepID=UPI00188520B3|nr:sex determination protein fruitless-like [Pollicipes pollicipes]